MDATAIATWVLQNVTVVLFIGLAGGMAWRDDHQQTVAASRDVIASALSAARLPQKVAAADLQMDEGTFSRTLDAGGAFFARLIDLGIRHPVFGAALCARMGELLRASSESPVERYERLVRELYELPQKEPVQCKSVEEPRAWSSAPR